MSEQEERRRRVSHAIRNIEQKAKPRVKVVKENFVNNEGIVNELKSNVDTSSVSMPNLHIGPKEESNKLEKVNSTEVNKSEETNTSKEPEKSKSKLDEKLAMDKSSSLSFLRSQIRRKWVHRGLRLNMMIVGEQGVGKATLMDALFDAEISDKSSNLSDMSSSSMVLIEGDVRLYLTVITSVDFSGDIDNSQCWQPLVQYAEEKMEHYFLQEQRSGRVADDSRVHVCLYLVPPRGGQRGLSKLDIAAIKALQTKVNVLPVVTKADGLTSVEKASVKKIIREQMEQNDIEVVHQDVPFAVVSASHANIKEHGFKENEEKNGKEGRQRRQRCYPWGTVDVEADEHSELVQLRRFLISTHYVHLLDRTHDELYERFREDKMKEEKGERDDKVIENEVDVEELEKAVLTLESRLASTKARLEADKATMDKMLKRQREDLDKKRREFEEEVSQWEKSGAEKSSTLGAKQSLESLASLRGRKKSPLSLSFKLGK